jgi:type IV pilus assembly protein PilP
MNVANISRISSFLLYIAAAFALSGCVSRDMSDLEQYVEEVLARKGGQIEPLPPIKPYERYLYQAAELGKRDPFESFLESKPEESKIEQITDSEQQKYTDEIMTHNREALEEFELDSLRMVGILENNDELWGIIEDNGGTVHRVQVGNYMGRNFGKIINIQEDSIELREITKSSQGQWEERQAKLALTEE